VDLPARQRTPRLVLLSRYCERIGGGFTSAKRLVSTCVAQTLTWIARYVILAPYLHLLQKFDFAHQQHPQHRQQHLAANVLPQTMLNFGALGPHPHRSSALSLLHGNRSRSCSDSDCRSELCPPSSTESHRLCLSTLCPSNPACVQPSSHVLRALQTISVLVARLTRTHGEGVIKSKGLLDSPLLLIA
jgi:hypothetical protein